MSRTDKDRPWPLRADDPRERMFRLFDHTCILRGDPCDAHISNTEHFRNGNRRGGRCGWSLSYYHGNTTAPRWVRAASWFNPERSRERDDLAKLAHEYNTYGDIEDDDFPCPQHRHECLWWWL